MQVYTVIMKTHNTLTKPLQKELLLQKRMKKESSPRTKLNHPGYSGQISILKQRYRLKNVWAHDALDVHLSNT